MPILLLARNTLLFGPATEFAMRSIIKGKSTDKANISKSIANRLGNKRILLLCYQREDQKKRQRRRYNDPYVTHFPFEDPVYFMNVIATRIMYTQSIF
jgi:hypothetical protein